MLSLNQSPFHAALSRAQTTNKPFLGSGLQSLYFPFENCSPLKCLGPPVKESLLDNDSYSGIISNESFTEKSVFEFSKSNDFNCDKNGNKTIENDSSPTKPRLADTIKETIQALTHSDSFSEKISKGKEAKKADNLPSKFQFPCGLQNAQMNSAEKLTMTGSSNHRNEQLGWISDVASKSPSNPVDVDNEKICSPLMHNVNVNSSTLLLSNAGSVFGPPVVLARNCEAGNVRMFTPPFQAERVRHLQRTCVPLSGNGTSPYYSQAPRIAPYSNFFHPAYPATTTYHPVTSPPAPMPSSNPPESARSYLQTDNFTTLSSLGPNMQPVNTPHLQIPCSTGYMQQSSVSSPNHAAPHARLFQQGRSILISRSPEGMTLHSAQEREPCHVRIQLSPVSSQMQEEPARRKSYASAESAMGSSSCSPVLCDSIHGISRTSDFSASSDFSRQHNVSPSHTGYRLPTGKEGSLKHRILRPPSINIIDPPPSVIADAPLSAPPIRTHREPSPKQARSIPSSGYRSFSSSASSITETPFVNNISSAHGSPSLGPFPNHCSSLSSGSVSPAPPNSPGSTAQLKYPQSFMKGSIIQLANNQLKQVENLTTEDFIECGLLSPTLKIDSSTVVTVEKMPSAGAAKLGFHVGQNNLQITVEAPLEHPFFVYKQGWSSCSPERSLQRYGLICHKLKVGDVCISLTEKRNTSKDSHKTAESTPKKSGFSVPTSRASPSSNENIVSESNTASNGNKRLPPSQTFRLPLNYSLSEKTIATNNNVSQKQSTSVPSPQKPSVVKNEATSSSIPGKRKRRWSAPDNFVQNEEALSIAS